MLLSAGFNQAIVKNNRYNWDIINESDIVILVDKETTDEMIIEFPTSRLKDELLPMFQT